MLKKTVDKARERWLLFEETGQAYDLGKPQLYIRDARYPDEARKLIERLVTEVYGRRHPNVIVAGRPRIDLPYTGRDLAKIMLREHEQEFLAAMGDTTWTSADGTVHNLPHPTFIEKFIRSLKHVKYDSYFGEYFSCKICLEIILSWKAIVELYSGTPAE